MPPLDPAELHEVAGVGRLDQLEVLDGRHLDPPAEVEHEGVELDVPPGRTVLEYHEAVTGVGGGGAVRGRVGGEGGVDAGPVRQGGLWSGGGVLRGVGPDVVPAPTSIILSRGVPLRLHGLEPLEHAGRRCARLFSHNAVARRRFGRPTTRAPPAAHRQAVPAELRDAHVHDAGPVPEEVGRVRDAAALDLARPGEVECGCVTYTANLLGNRPRIMDVCIPQLGGDGLAVCGRWRPGGGPSETPPRDGVVGEEASAASPGMLERFKAVQAERNSAGENYTGGGGNNVRPDPPQDAPAGPQAALADGAGVDTALPADTAPDSASPSDPRHGLMVLQNRPPWWNVELNAFVLNFGGRVKVASVKNFQLVESPDSGHFMQFGRIEGRHSFTMDFEWPLSPVQAFGVAISSLQSKISFG